MLRYLRCEFQDGFKRPCVVDFARWRKLDVCLAASSKCATEITFDYLNYKSVYKMSWKLRDYFCACV